MHAVASIAYRRKYYKVNKTITVIDLKFNKIGDAGAVAFAESLKAMFLTGVLQVRATLFSWQCERAFTEDVLPPVAQQCWCVVP